MTKLSVLIPTYNRASKVYRLLKNIEDIIDKSNITDKIEVLVSDNASKDNTEKLISTFSSPKFEVQYFRQETNLGFDGNIKFLYEKANSEYIWFFADDDMMLPNAMDTVLEGLDSYKPDVLLFSFIQPPGSQEQTYNFNTQYQIVTDKKQIVELVFQCTKVSVYVLKKKVLSELEQQELAPFRENGFYFVNLAYTILHNSNPRLCIISKPLATCDEDYNLFDYTPGTFRDMYKIFYHPFVIKNYPEYAEIWKDRSYYHEIMMLFGIKIGTILTQNMEIYDKGIREIEFRMLSLTKNIHCLILLIIMKLRLTGLYKILRPYIKKLKNNL